LNCFSLTANNLLGQHSHLKKRKVGRKHRIKHAGPHPTTQQEKKDSRTSKEGTHSRSTGCCQPLTETAAGSKQRVRQNPAVLPTKKQQPKHNRPNSPASNSQTKVRIPTPLIEL